MQTINLNDVAGWRPVQAGEIVTFEPVDEAYRLVAVDVLVPTGCEFWVGSLRAAGEGMHEVRFSITEPVGCFFTGDGGAYRSKTPASEVVRVDEPSFTVIEPRRETISAEVRAVMQVMQVNANRRFEQLTAEFERRLSEQAARENAAPVIEGGGGDAVPA